MRSKIILLLTILFIGSFAKAQKLDISGFARTYEGVTYKNGDFVIIQQTLNLNFEKRGDRVAFKANPMVYFYNSDSININIREVYMDMYFRKI